MKHDAGRASRIFLAAAASLVLHGALLTIIVAFGPAHEGDLANDTHVPFRLVMGEVPSPRKATANPPTDPERSRLDSAGKPQTRNETAGRLDTAEKLPAEKADDIGKRFDRQAPVHAPRYESPRSEVATQASPETVPNGRIGPSQADESVNLVTQSAMTDTIVPEPSATENAGVAKMPAVQGADLDLLRKGYALVVRQRLEMASRYPGSARRAGRDGSVVLRLHVASDGSIGKTSIESSSTWPDLDQAAVGAANQLSNLPPPPGGSIDVIVPVRFSLRDR